MKIKQMLTKVKPVFSFFDFYYNVIKRNDKKYEIASIFPNNFFIFLTPVILMILQMIIGAVISSAILTASLFIWIPIIVANIVFSNIVDSKGREIKRRRESIAREKERQQQLKRERERQRQQQERFEKMYRDFFANGGYNGQQTQCNTVDQNMINAMKLMSLTEGFTKQDLKSAYRRLSKIHHPDVKITGSEANFKKLVTAYEYVLERI